MNVLRGMINPFCDYLRLGVLQPACNYLQHRILQSAYDYMQFRLLDQVRNLLWQLIRQYNERYIIDALVNQLKRLDRLCQDTGHTFDSLMQPFVFNRSVVNPLRSGVWLIRFYASVVLVVLAELWIWLLRLITFVWVFVLNSTCPTTR